MEFETVRHRPSLHDLVAAGAVLTEEQWGNIEVAMAHFERSKEILIDIGFVEIAGRYLERPALPREMPRTRGLA